MIGTTAGHYRIRRVIGSGGMGVVYEADDTRLGRRVALKFIAESIGDDGLALERFQREARAASALNHPNICTVYAIEFKDGQPFIVMELLAGETLAARMSRGRLPLADVVDFGLQIADALESAHAKGVVHRDIKPANVFVSPRGQVKVLDFGLAKIAASRRHETEVATATVHATGTGAMLGTIAYMSPEQARGQLTDARSDVFSLGTTLYEMATGALPFRGDTSAVVFDAILNRDAPPPADHDPSLPPELSRILEKALEKDPQYRYQSSNDLRTDLIRLRRTVDAVRDRAAAVSERSIAVTFFENLGGSKEDDYLRDGITEDIITELAKIGGLDVFSRATVLGYRDRPASPATIGGQLNATYVLTGSLRRAGSRLRINAQLVDTRTEFPVWSERYDREMQDVFDVQDEIARSIAGSLRITLTPQEAAALAAKPTGSPQAYDLYLRGRSHVRRQTRQDLEVARQLFENAVALDPAFALAHAAMAHVCALRFYLYGNDPAWLETARTSADLAASLAPALPEVEVARAWVHYANREYAASVDAAEHAVAARADCEGGYYVLGRALFALGRYQDVASRAESAIQAAGEDYNVFSPIANAVGALGKTAALRAIRQRRMQALEAHLNRVPEDVRCRVLLAIDYGSVGRTDDALREITMAIALRPDEAMVLYNAACALAMMEKKPEAMDALRKAWEAGFRDADWVRRDPDLALLHGDAEFDRLYPA